MGLLSWIWDGIRAKVKALIDSATAKIKDWARGFVKAAINAVDWVVNNITKIVTNIYKTVEEYITNVYNYVTENITNVVNNITENITNNITNITKNITNVIGASKEWVKERLIKNREWMENFVKLLVPIGFTSDPVGYVKAIINIWKDPWMNSVVKSFWMGFEEGLAEEA